MYQFELLRDEIRDLKGMMSHLLLQAQPLEPVQLPAGLQLPMETMSEIDDMENQLIISRDLHSSVVRCLTVLYFTTLLIYFIIVFLLYLSYSHCQYSVMFLA